MDHPNHGRKMMAPVASTTAGYTLKDVNYGINQIFTTHENNNINVNMGQAVAQCSGKRCAGGADITQTVSQRMAYPTDSRAYGSDSGGENILNLDEKNDIWLKNGQSVSQCVGIGCKASSSEDQTVDSSSARLMMPTDSSRAFDSPIVTVLLENLDLGEGNIINIGDSSSDSINIGDGTSQCVGRGCFSSSEAYWKAGPSNARAVHLIPSVLDSLNDYSDTSESTDHTVILKNLTLSEGNIINIGNDNILSINIGDGASQCVGDKCKSISEKRSSYSARAFDPTIIKNATQVYNGYLQGTPDFPFTIIFKNVVLGYGNIINIGNLNGNGIAAGDGVAQCIGSYCHSVVSKEFSVINTNSSSNSTSRSFVPVEGDARWSLFKPSFVKDTPFPFMLYGLYLGEANVLNFGQKNTISINIGDGASQCVGNKCLSKALRAGDFSSLPNGGSSGGGTDPMKPSDVRAQDITNTTVTITWKDASADPPDVSYVVNCVQGTETKCDDSGVSVSGIAQKVETATVTGLSPGTAYECWVEMKSTILNNHCSKDPARFTTTQ